MSNVQRVMRGPANAGKVAIAANVKLEVGDLVYKAGANAVPATGLTWSSSYDQTAGLEQGNFLGVSLDAHNTSEGATNVLVAQDCVAKFPISGAIGTAVAPGTLVSPVSYGADKLANQWIIVSGSTSGSIGRTVETIAAGTAAGTNVLVHLQGISYRDVENS